MRVLIQNKIDDKRFEYVLQQMKQLGAPFINGFILPNDIFYATEGSHRLTAAYSLNIIPVLNPIMSITNEDIQDDDKCYFINMDAKSREARNLFIDFKEIDL